MFKASTLIIEHKIQKPILYIHLSLNYVMAINDLKTLLAYLNKSVFLILLGFSLMGSSLSRTEKGHGSEKRAMAPKMEDSAQGWYRLLP